MDPGPGPFWIRVRVRVRVRFSLDESKIRIKMKWLLGTSFWEERELSLFQKLNFLISIFLEPDDVNLWYFKLRLFDLTEFLVRNNYDVRPLVAKIERLENLSLWQRLNSFGIVNCNSGFAPNLEELVDVVQKSLLFVPQLKIIHFSETNKNISFILGLSNGRVLL